MKEANEWPQGGVSLREMVFPVCIVLVLPGRLAMGAEV